MDLCFQMFAEVKDVDELLEMVRSTCDTDYIRLDGQTQELQLMNPSKFFKKYLMPTNLPKSIATDETITLQKGYYKGIVFNIPGAEVLINGEWIPFTAQNEQRIKMQNTMNLEWRLNSALYKKMGYNNGQKVSGTIIAVDDQWNGLSITKDFSVQVK